jgi:hypothetical protein
MSLFRTGFSVSCDCNDGWSLRAASSNISSAGRNVPSVPSCCVEQLDKVMNTIQDEFTGCAAWRIGMRRKAGSTGVITRRFPSVMAL